MTPISELSNEQLDKLIAERREPIPVGFIEEGEGLSPKGNWVCPMWHWFDDKWYPQHFTADPRYAFELLEEMTNPQIVKTVDFWKVVLDSEASLEEYVMGAHINLCRAIAEAWLEWKEKK